MVRRGSLMVKQRFCKAKILEVQVLSPAPHVSQEFLRFGRISVETEGNDFSSLERGYIRFSAKK